MDIYLAINEQQTGPFSEEEVRRRIEMGDLSDTTLGWEKGRTDWQPLRDLLGLVPCSPPPPPPPKVNEPTSSHEMPASNPPPTQTRRGFFSAHPIIAWLSIGLNVILILIALVLLVSARGLVDAVDAGSRAAGKEIAEQMMPKIAGISMEDSLITTYACISGTLATTMISSPLSIPDRVTVDYVFQGDGKVLGSDTIYLKTNNAGVKYVDIAVPDLKGKIVLLKIHRPQ